ncbi:MULTISPECIES: sigma-70 family RNA polymerase sigma factor [Nonomuraea]|uniref:Sigma-70 family RNA polymerase sigma factor n=2 Tax=Nonomuraea TaxID=83681 RepID=A0ABW1C5H1_9ACTN|nr:MULTISPECIES: sigma-70 family RNA polymerase sigma factor [Nonomuraea]MDA0639195.1 sigma-70 family RNA polymerase sigma factor [Nonomuraea ferruginea]TXK35358.1 sigma-70 family RNA polymerase sigma factor [Nonomuraea sp. C10]
MPDSWPFSGLLAPAVAAPARTTEPDVRENRDTTAADDDLRTLVLHAKTGDSDAFGTLYDRYVDLVYRYIYFRVGSHPLAEDLTSETFLRALRRITDFTWQGRDFGAWLVTIARNLVTDHYKSGRYRLEISTGEVLDVPLDGAHIPENAVVNAIINDRVLRAVRDLNPEQQECVVLRFLHGLSLAETALIMGKKSGAIKALQFRAVRALARALKHDLA